MEAQVDELSATNQVSWILIRVVSDKLVHMVKKLEILNVCQIS
jgi:hypothetical protein